MNLDDEVRRGGRAREVLEHEEFKKAFATVEEVYLAAIRSSGFTDTATREKMSLRYACLHDVRTALQSVLETGEIAEEQIRQETIAQKMKKAVGWS